MNVLTSLKAAKGRFVSGQYLAGRLGLTRAAVHKQVARLRADGNEIQGTNRRGYRLLAAAEVWPAGGFTGPLGGPLHRHLVLSSTQDEAKRLALNGAPEGALVVAERQSRGRGRLGRAWSSPPGGLWFSLVLRPRFAPSEAGGLALAAGLSWARVLGRLGVDARVKWPNDVWVGRRKILGILTEMAADMDRVQWAVLGVGVNVNNPAPVGTSTPAVSLRRLLGRAADRPALLSAWLKDFGHIYRRYAAGGFSTVRKPYENRLILKGKTVVCRAPHGTVKGRVLGVGPAGELRLKRPDGGLFSVHAGDVSLR